MATRTCDKCQAQLRVTDLAKAVRCPKCKQVLQPVAATAGKGGSSYKHIPVEREHSENATEEVSILETIITSPMGRAKTRPREPDRATDEEQQTASKPVPPQTPPRRAVPEGPRASELGPYEILKEIGRGGMGLVVQGYDQALKREVAIKTLHPQTRADPVKRMRFIKEAQITGQLEHPGIVPVHYLGWDGEGNEFFSMKLASGEPLDKILERWHKGDAKTLQKYSLTRLLSIFERVCETIEFAHSRSVMHRDLKPGNVMIGTHGEVWVLDWGLAKVIGSSDDESRPAASDEGPKPRIKSDVANDVTLDGLVVGTPEYMAPEQAAGEVLDEGVDIFALGAILYEILTSQPPRTGTTVNEIVTKAAQGRFTPVRRTAKGKNAPAALSAVAEKCLAPERRKRYSSVQDLIQDLRSYAAGLEVSARPDTKMERIRRTLRRHRKLVALSGSIAALLLIVITIASVVIAQKDREARVEQDRALQAKIEEQKAKLEKQEAIAASAEKAQRRLKAFEPYVQAMDLLMRDQLPERAAALLDKSLQIDPDFPEAQFALAEAYRMAGIPGKAAEHYLKADELSVRIAGRRNLHALVAAGFTYDGAGEYDKAQDCFERAAKFGANDPLAKVGRCFNLSYERRLNEARKLAEEAMSAGEHLWEAHFAAGYVSLEQMKDGYLPPAESRAAAIAAFRKALELSPRQAETHVWLAHALQAGTPSTEESEEAKRLIDRSIELEPLNGNRYIVRASLRANSGDVLGAASDIADARRLNAWEPLILVFESHKAIRANDYPAGFELMKQALQRGREWPPHVCNWLNIGFSLNKKDECMPVFERWAKNNPNYVFVDDLKATMKVREGDLKGGIEVYRKALERTPYNVVLLRHLVTALLMDRQFKEGISVTEKALELVPGDPGLLLIKARILIELKRFDTAAGILDQLEKNPTSVLKREVDSLRKLLDQRRKPPEQ
ncbi:MAG TPA: protein kinase [Planctomycetota bacterium]|nr:protein kinase [Planctomycetota bacterium]